MSVSKKLESLKKKVAALLAMTTENGASEQEALNAMAMASKLMLEHGLTEQDIKNSTSNDFVRQAFDDHRKQLHEVDKYLAVALAEYCEVKVYADREKGGIVFFGYNVDIELATYLRKVCRFAMEYEWNMYFANYRGGEHGKTVRKQFMVGMTRRLANRLKTLKSDNTVYSSSTALISLKNQMVDQEFAKRYDLKLKKSQKSKPVKMTTAYMAGHAAGEKVSLNRKMESETTTVLAIKGY